MNNKMPDYAADIIQTLREPLLVLDASLRVRIASRAFYTTFKATPEQTQGQLIYELGNGQWDIPSLRTLLEDLLPTNGEFNDYQVEHDFPTIGRRIMQLNARRLHDGNNQTQLILLAIEDVTERRAFEHRLSISETRYRRLFEAAHDGILILDAASAKITDVNPFMLHLLDFPREHFIGRELWEIGLFHDKREAQQAMEKLQREKTLRYEDKPLEKRDGGQVPVEVIANVYLEDSHPVIQCNIRDISGRKRFEREREAMLVQEQALRMEAEAANRAKDVFLATLSHEIRTPLSAILGWAVLLRREDCNAEDLKEGLESIERNARAQSQLIEDVLDVSRIVSGKLRLEITSCNLGQVIAAAIDAVRPAAHAKQIQITPEIDPEAVKSSCDASRMQQVIWNLLSNAVKFTPKGGNIQIRLGREKSSVFIEVHDTGLGINPEFLPFVFERFRQADGSSTRSYAGLGLGLSIVRHIIELHGGTVSASSAGEGHGSTFTIKLPIAAVYQAESPGDEARRHENAEATDELSAVRLDGLHVLVVDDEPDARRMITHSLQAAGATVTAADSAAEALKLLTKIHPQILISDIGMPNQDGYQLIQRIRSEGHSARDLPAVALTAFAQKKDERHALLAGYQVHVSKPVDPHDLWATVASLAGRTGGTQG